MEIDEALKAVDKSLKRLRIFPKSEKVADIQYYYTTARKADLSKAQSLAYCKALLAKITQEIEASVAKYTDDFFKNIEVRKAFIESQHANNVREVLDYSEKTNLIRQIELCEKQNNKKIEKIALNESDTLKLIKKMHENSFPPKYEQLKKYFQKYVFLDFKKTTEKEEESLKSILELIGKYKD